MTIDEHIKGLRKRADEYWDRLCSDNLSYIGSIAQSRDNDAYIILSELIKLLEELKWYREQDLIKREDVYDAFRWAIEYEPYECDLLDKIPKAEQ